MSLPVLNADDVEKIVTNCNVIGLPMKGGQKLVFPCEISGEKCAVKFILLCDSDNDDLDTAIIDTISARAYREVKIMGEIDSPYVVKLGSTNLACIDYNSQKLLYYSEEWIDGVSVDKYFQKGILASIECINLCHNVTTAISTLWRESVVHRDIKPQNIVRRNNSGEYVLLDMGIAFDLEDKSLTQYKYIPGTKIFFSPEQLDYNHKRDIDFRSDLFSLGVVLYLGLTGTHPFYKKGMTDDELFHNICYTKPIDIKSLNSTVPEELCNIVNRLLDKQPHGRYRKCEILLRELDNCKLIMGVQK